MLALLLSTCLIAQAAGDSKHSDDAFAPDPAWKELGKSLWFDPKERGLIVRARVVLNEGFLEHLLCRDRTKEHESILSTDAVPRQMHAGLLLAGAEAGKPVQFRPEFRPPSGTPIAIELEWSEGGKTKRADAKTWVKDERTGKTLAVDWVFGGGHLFEDPDTKRMIYSPDGGDVITVSNFVSAMLDVPFASSAEDTARTFVARTEVIPPRGTPVTMILRPAKPKSKPR